MLGAAIAKDAEVLVGLLGVLHEVIRIDGVRSVLLTLTLALPDLRSFI